MLSAVAADAAGIDGVLPVVPVDPRFGLLDSLSSIEQHCVKPTAPWSACWLELAATCDAAIVIAPEDGPLSEAASIVERSGAKWIGCRGEALQAGICKHQFAQKMCDAEIPTPATWTAHEAAINGTEIAAQYGWVTKPINSCGSQAIRRHATWESVVAELSDCGRSHRIVQPRWLGRAASCSVLCGPSQRIVLPPVWQQLDEHTFEYLGGSGPIADNFASRATQLALRAVEALGSSVGGYIGIDLILGDAEDGSDDAVIEANPRITTSYVGLRRMVLGNIVEMLVGLADQRPVAYQMRSTQFKFSASGTIDECQ